MMKGLIEIKSSILSAASKAQLNHAVSEACSAGRYQYADDCDFAENAEMALMQGKPAVAEILRLAGKVEGRL